MYDPAIRVMVTPQLMKRTLSSVFGGMSLGGELIYIPKTKKSSKDAQKILSLKDNPVVFSGKVEEGLAFLASHRNKK